MHFWLGVGIGERRVSRANVGTAGAGIGRASQWRAAAGKRGGEGGAHYERGTGAPRLDARGLGAARQERP